MKNFSDIYERKVDVIQRKKQARRMRKMAKSKAFQFKKRKSMMRMRNPAKLALVARKKTIQSFRNKFYPGYNNIAIQQKVKVDQMIIQKYGKKIDKVSKRLAKKLQKDETQRVKQARASFKTGKEDA